jgi:hypothetical protein
VRIGFRVASGFIYLKLLLIAHKYGEMENNKWDPKRNERVNKIFSAFLLHYRNEQNHFLIMSVCDSFTKSSRVYQLYDRAHR